MTDYANKEKLAKLKEAVKAKAKAAADYRRYGREAVDYAIRDLITSPDSSEIFYGHLAARLKKIVIDENYRGKYYGVKTAAVALDGNDVVLIVYSPFFDALTDLERIAVVKHELQHVGHRHLFRGTVEKGYHPRIANIAMDAVINQLNDNLPEGCVDYKLIEGAKPHDSFENYYDLLVDAGENEGDDGDDTCDNCGGSGEEPDNDAGDDKKDENGDGGSGDENDDAGDNGDETGSGDGDGDEEGENGSDGGEGDGEGDGADDGHGNGSGGGDHDENATKPCSCCGGSGKNGGASPGGEDTKYGKVVDSHDFFGKGDEDTNMDLAEEGLKGKIRKAAAATSKSCGNVSAEIKGILAEINEPHKVNWRKVLRNWASEAYKREKNYSPFKEHKVFSDVYPGSSFKRLPEFAVYVDVSGSVGSEEFNAFMRELVGINKALKASLTVSQFDTKVHKTDKVSKKTDIPKLTRDYSGGTRFDDILRHARETKNRSLIIMTDGYAPEIDTTGFNVLWAYTPDHHKHKGKGVVIED